MRKLGLALLAVLAHDAQAGEGGCLSTYTQFDLCKFANEVQSGLAPMLPMRMNKNLTLSRVMVLGSQVVFYAVWDQSNADIDERLRAAGMTKDGLIDTMKKMAYSTVCGQEETAAFIRLGGKMSYHYVTSDAVPVTMVTVDQCPRS